MKSSTPTVGEIHLAEATELFTRRVQEFKAAEDKAAADFEAAKRATIQMLNYAEAEFRRAMDESKRLDLYFNQQGAPQ
jgi:hypothetical protein